MKTKAILFFVALLALSLIQLVGHGNGPGRGGLLRSTGAPGETHCGACHTDGGYNGEMLVHEVSQQGAILNGYLPGGTHVFIVEILSVDTFINGGMQFQIVDSLGNKAGSFLPGNTANAHLAIPWNYNWHQYIEQPRPILPVRFGGANRIYIGAAWIANPLYHGPVTLYASGTICDGDSTPNGDNSYNRQVTLYPSVPLEADSQPGMADGIIPTSSILKPGHFSAHYHEGFLDIQLTSDEPKRVDLDIYNAHGQHIKKASILILSTGVHKQTLEFNFPPGAYFITADFPEEMEPQMTCKFMVSN